MNSQSVRQLDLEAGGFSTRVYEAGTSDSEPLVLVHDGAFGTDAMLCWGDLIPILADRFHVIAPDMLGWGATDKAIFFDRSSFEFRMSHILRVVDQLVGPDSRPHFVGASFGGSLLLHSLANSTLSDVASSVVSISGTGGPYRIDEFFTKLGNFEPTEEDARRITELVVGHTENLAEHVRRRYENSLVEGHWEAMNAPKLARQTGPRSDATKYPEVLAAVDTPILLIEGAQDVLLESGWAAKMSSVIGSEHVSVDGGHEPNIDKPVVIAELVRDFIERVNAAGR